MADKRKTIGLALGSGGFRGPAHIGVIKTLLKHNIPIDYIAGSSIGALVGAYYALNREVSALEKEIAISQRDKVLLFLDISRSGGLLSGERIKKLISKILKGADFKNTKIPFKAITTDLISGDSVILCKGDLAEAVRASVSVPLTFRPVKFKDKLLIDGGLSNPVPDNIVKDMGADIVISVNLYNKFKYDYPNPPMAKVIMRAAEIMLYDLAKSNLRHTDILINPDTTELARVSRFKKYFDSSAILKMIKAGEDATEKVIPDIKKLLAQK
jgi:NTE family protein